MDNNQLPTGQPAPQPPAPIHPPAPQAFRPGDTISPQHVIADPIAPAPAPPPTPPIHEDKYEGQIETVEPHMHSNGDSVTWTASEFIAHHKAMSWYMLLAGGACLLAIIVYIVFKDLISSGVILVCAAMFGMFAGRTPRQLRYSLDDYGITVGARHYAYSEFRSFALADEGAFASIVFMPLKRFGQIISVLYDPSDEEQIMQVLAHSLPMQDHRRDAVDSLMQRIRF